MHSVGDLRKMLSSIEGKSVHYKLIVGDEVIDLNSLVGREVTFEYQGEIHCVACGRRTKKSYSQGHCYPCSQSLASCDLCIMKPETCHYGQGTCREPSWGEENCFQGHTVYLSNTSGVKVGITRNSQIPTRWVDQGATQALPIVSVKNRLLSGLVEVAIKKHVADRTDWRKMLKGGTADVDLFQEKARLLDAAADDLEVIIKEQGSEAISIIDDKDIQQLSYPVTQYPEKVKSFNFDKTAVVKGMLDGIKGQYLILDSGVINIRKFSGYKVSFSVI